MELDEAVVGEAMAEPVMLPSTGWPLGVSVDPSLPVVWIDCDSVSLISVEDRLVVGDELPWFPAISPALQSPLPHPMS